MTDQMICSSTISDSQSDHTINDHIDDPPPRTPPISTDQNTSSSSQLLVPICPRCHLRHNSLGASSAQYLLPANELADLVRAQYSTTSGPVLDEDDDQSGRCPACIGLLQGHIRDLISISDLADLCRPYSPPASYCLAISVPSLCLLRDACIRARISSSSGGGGGGEQRARAAPIPVKDVLRAVLAAEIMPQVLPGIPAQPSSAFRIDIDLNDINADSVVQRDLLRFIPRTLPRNLAHTRLRRTSQTSGKFVDRAISVISSEELAAIRLDHAGGTVPRATLSICRAAVYLAGSYIKLCRRLSQTPWLVNDQKNNDNDNDNDDDDDGDSRISGSVQELIASRFIELFGPNRQYKFHSAGREDIDVRMLGSGRDFLLEILDPLCIPDADQIEACRCAMMREIDVIEIPLSLHYIQDPVIHFKDLEHGARTKTKSYRAVVWASTPLTESLCRSVSTTIPFEIQQWTPIRVLHRRALLARPRTIHRLILTPINAQFAVLDLETQAGTYIKELVHGDRGRTQPNLGSMLSCCQADILQLDVLDLHQH